MGGIKKGTLLPLPETDDFGFSSACLLDMDLGRHQDSRSVSREVGGVLSIPHSHTTQF